MLGVQLILSELNANALLLELHFVFFSQENFNHCNVMSSKPPLNNLYSKPLCGTLSNFLAKGIHVSHEWLWPTGEQPFLGELFFPK